MKRRGSTLAAAALAATMTSSCRKPKPPADLELAPAENPVEPATSASAAALPIPSRCAALGPGSTVVVGDDARPPGPDPLKVRTASSNEAESERSPEAGADEWLPFAAEVGEGIAAADGFAVGVAAQGEHATFLGVLTLGADGSRPAMQKLGSVRGDAEPPRVAARGDALLAAVLDTTHGSRALRLAKIDSGKITWGASIPERTDESQAFDLALGSTRGVAVWDEETLKGGAILAATFDVANPSVSTTPRTLTDPTVDADSPRLVVRSNGFWLFYIAHAPEGAPGRGEDAGVAADELGSGEEIGRRWLEVVALDPNGSPSGPARSLSPRDGHVLVYDVAALPDDGALAAFRDEDAPSGSAGGDVLGTVVRPDRIDPPASLVEQGAYGGSPDLVPGWLALSDTTQGTRLAPLVPGRAALAGPLSGEADVGDGEVVAASGSALLVARPAGRAVRLSVLRCDRAPIAIDSGAFGASP